MSTPGEESAKTAVRFGPAVSLSYDAADPSHLEIVLPCLAEFGLRGTFYVTETGLLEDPRAWQAAQNEGHEIACGSLFGAADLLGNLPKWSLENVEEDLRQARKLYAELFPRQSDCSFAYPGPEALCMTVPYEPVPTPYRPIVESMFEVGRSALEGLVEPTRCDIQYLESVDARGLGMNDLVVAAEAALFSNQWTIFAFKEVGAGDGAIDVEAHQTLCAWLADRQDRVRTGTVYDLALDLRERKAVAEGAYSWSLKTES